MDVGIKLQEIQSYLSDILELSNDEVSIIKTCINYVHEQAPTEVPLIIKKTNDLIAASENLSWIILIVSRKIVEIQLKIKKVKSPAFTMLTRQGRPSATAIEYEILHNYPDIMEAEEQLDVLNKLLDYFKHLEKSIDRYLWMLRDGSSFHK